mmetsp:Transcript_124184/g.386721  ORF Transcript_124184/g.386721 Transcript_124184/m.386721 type:complete len:108 (-) Transcript_124184:300-623(-)
MAAPDHYEAAQLYRCCVEAHVQGDVESAAALCEQAAHLGHVEAMATLGAHYLAGEGVPLDSARAAGWLARAAERGHGGAQCNLSVLLMHGIGIPRDELEVRGIGGCR